MLATAEEGTTVTFTVLVRAEVDAAIEAGVIFVTSLRMAAMSSLVVGRTGFAGLEVVVTVVGLVMLVESEGVTDVVGGRGEVVVVVLAGREGAGAVLVTPAVGSKSTTAGALHPLFKGSNERFSPVGSLCSLLLLVLTSCGSRPFRR